MQLTTCLDVTVDSARALCGCVFNMLRQRVMEHIDSLESVKMLGMIFGFVAKFKIF